MRWLHLAVLSPLVAVALLGDSNVDRHVAAMQKAQSFKVTFSVTQVGGSTEEQTLVLSRPNKLRWESPAKLVVSDGKVLFSYDKAKKVYSKAEATVDSLKAALGVDAIWVWSAFFNEKFGDEVASSSKGSGRRVRDVAVTDLTLTRKDKRVFVLPLDDSHGIARGARFSTEEPKAEVIVLAKELTIGDAALGDELFAWTPPADAKDAVEAAKEASSNALHYEDVKAILAHSCVSCHSGAAPKDGIDLSSYQATMNSRVVRPGNAETSRLIRAVRSGKMPPLGPLAKDQIEKLAKWVADGALE